jgi:hypothetical protein
MGLHYPLEITEPTTRRLSQKRALPLLLAVTLVFALTFAILPNPIDRKTFSRTSGFVEPPSHKELSTNWTAPEAAKILIANNL